MPRDVMTEVGGEKERFSQGCPATCMWILFSKYLGAMEGFQGGGWTGPDLCFRGMILSHCVGCNEMKKDWQ